jgi:hypothetical protein
MAPPGLDGGIPCGRGGVVAAPGGERPGGVLLRDRVTDETASTSETEVFNGDDGAGAAAAERLMDGYAPPCFGGVPCGEAVLLGGGTGGGGRRGVSFWPRIKTVNRCISCQIVTLYAEWFKILSIHVLLGGGCGGELFSDTNVSSVSKSSDAATNWAKKFPGNDDDARRLNSTSWQTRRRRVVVSGKVMFEAGGKAGRTK